MVIAFPQLARPHNVMHDQLVNLIKTVWVEFGFDASHPSAMIFESELRRPNEIYMSKKSNYFVSAKGNRIIGGVSFSH